MEGYVYAQVIVEGSTDIPVVTALMCAAGWADSEFSVTSANGKGAIDRDIKKYWEAARVLPYVIFRDLDQDGEGCPVTLRVTTRAYLYLSGTPFKALATGEFIEEQIFNWTYTDEQSAKHK